MSHEIHTSCCEAVCVCHDETAARPRFCSHCGGFWSTADPSAASDLLDALVAAKRYADFGACPDVLVMVEQAIALGTLR